MAADFENQLREEALPLLEPGEEILASIVTQPRGTGAKGLATQFERAKATA